MKVIIFLIVSMLAFESVSSASTESEFDKIVESIESVYGKVSDYLCTMYKKELIDGKYIEKKNIVYKHKKPNKYYMKWTEGEDKGLEVIYAGKKYGNKLYVHPGGTFSFISTKIDPKGSMAMKDNRHTIFESDYGYIISMISTNFRKAKADKEGKFNIEETQDGSNSAGFTLTAEFPQGKGYYAGKIIIYLDKKHDLPTQFKVYDWNNKLLEYYKYSNLKINPGLKEIDFDVDNPDYEY